MGATVQDWPLWVQIALGIVVGLAVWQALRAFVNRFRTIDVIFWSVAAVIFFAIALGLLIFTSLDFSASKLWSGFQVLVGGGITLASGLVAIGGIASFDKPSVVGLSDRDAQKRLGDYYTVRPIGIGLAIVFGSMAIAFGGFAYRDYGQAFTNGFVWYHWLWT
jgi:hypothetical protein